MDKQTSDERLLKLIEGESGPKHPRVITPGIKKAPGNPLSVKLNIFELKTKLKGLKISLFFLNRGLIGIAVLLTLIFLYVLSSGPALSNGVLFSPADTSAIKKLISPDETQGLGRKNMVIQEIKRDFFLPAGSIVSADTQGDEPDLTEEMKHLKLVGIIWSLDQEVMIENAKDSRTYTFRKGEVLNGQFKVKDISRTAAVLEVPTGFGPKEYVLR